MRCLDGDMETEVWKRQLHTDLVSVVKELQDGEDAGSNEQTHLTPDVTCEQEKERKKLLLLVSIKRSTLKQATADKDLMSI